MIGVVGGGQLAQMMAQAADSRKIDVAVQASSIADPASSLAAKLVVADPTDAQATKELIQCCSSITFENEWVDIEGLAQLNKSEEFRFKPSLSALRPLIDKISQRMLLDELGIPSPKWIRLSELDKVDLNLPNGWNFPVMAKASKGGYDGKGTLVIRDKKELKYHFDNVDPDKWLLESWVPFEKELAVVATRDDSAKIRVFPIAETNQLLQVCDWVIAPADIDYSVKLMAYNVVSSLLTKLDYVGVLAIEFFYGPDGLLVNELAPRTHNSAHFTIEACFSSQFDQQTCITAGLPVPSTELISTGALMVNLLGLQSGLGDSLDLRLSKLRQLDGINFHWYGKDKETPGRKLGHVTFLLQSENALERREEAKKHLERIRKIWPAVTTLEIKKV